MNDHVAATAVDNSIVAREASVATLDSALEVAQNQAEQIVEMLESAALITDPALGQIVDLSV